MSHKKSLHVAIYSFITLVLLAVSAALYFTLKTDMGKLISLIAFIVILVIALIYSYWHFARPSKIVRSSIKQTQSHLQHTSIDKARSTYMKMYNHYLKLSEHKRRNFYTKIKFLHEAIEDVMVAEKKMESLLHKAQEATVQELSKMYEQAHNLFKKLPTKDQERHYPRLSHIKEKAQGKH